MLKERQCGFPPPCSSDIGEVMLFLEVEDLMCSIPFQWGKMSAGCSS